MLSSRRWHSQTSAVVLMVSNRSCVEDAERGVARRCLIGHDTDDAAYVTQPPRFCLVIKKTRPGTRVFDQGPKCLRPMNGDLR